MFEEHKDKKGNSIKTMKEFLVQITHTETVSTGTVEDWMTMGRILKEHGLGMKDFKDEQAALAAVRHLCKQNAEEHGYGSPPEALDKDFMVFSKFWYVIGKGRDSTSTGSTSKSLQATGQIKNAAQLAEGMVFMEGLGFQDGKEIGEPKVVNVKAEALGKQLELLKTSYLTLNVCIFARMCVYLYIYIYICIRSHTAPGTIQKDEPKSVEQNKIEPKSIEQNSYGMQLSQNGLSQLLEPTGIEPKSIEQNSYGMQLSQKGLSQLIYCKCNRIDVKKFVDAKAPLNMMKLKMQMKADKDPQWEMWANELTKMTTEQHAFLEDLEWNIAVAEAIEPAEVILFPT